jgi:CheY-like chemotaxis protein
MQGDRPRRILVIEDNPTDVSLIKEALTEHGVSYEMTVLDDGEKALAHLRNIGELKPDLVIIDLNMPKRDGVEVLLKYRMTVGLYSVPMIVLTSSNSRSDLLRTKNIGVSAFIQKPMTLPEFISLGKRFKAILEQPFIYIGPREGKG